MDGNGLATRFALIFCVYSGEACMRADGNENAVAKNLYRSLGFKPTGKVDKGEHCYALAFQTQCTGSGWAPSSKWYLTMPRSTLLKKPN